MENIDPVYECDAPLYVDFEQIKQSGGLEDDGADSWFERHKVQDKVEVNDNVGMDAFSSGKEIEYDEKMCTPPDASPDTCTEIELTPRPMREAALKANHSIHSLLVNKSQLLSLTTPETPEVLKRYRQKKVGVGKSSEELELDRIKELRKAAEKHLQESRRSFKKLMNNQESHATLGIEENGKERDGQQRGTKRHRRSSKPLHHLDERIDELSKSKKPKCDAYVPVAEQLMKYHKATPPRFRTKRQDAPAANKGPFVPCEPTKPKTPKLLTKTRSRSMCIESAAEKEEKEVKEIESFQFKAKPFNPKIVALNGRLGVPDIKRKPLTYPKDPMLTIELKTKKSEEEPVKKEFRARPLPKGILEGVKGLPERKMAEFTNPESPNFALKKRKMEWDSKKKEPTPEPPIKRSAPPVDQPVFQPELPHKKTEVEPFSFESRYEGKPTRRDIVNVELKKQAEELVELVQFKAHPMPSFTAPQVAKPERKIEPQPFQLQSEIRGEKYQKEFREKIKKNEEEAQIGTMFKATGNKAIYSKPFVPVKAARPLLEVENFVLNTEQRSQQRALYEKEKRDREQMKEEEMAAVRIEEEEVEQKRMAEYRRSLQHHAQPIRHYKPVEVSYGDKELTTPLTPTLITSQRRRSVK